MTALGAEYHLYTSGALQANRGKPSQYYACMQCRKHQEGRGGCGQTAWGIVKALSALLRLIERRGALTNAGDPQERWEHKQRALKRTRRVE